MRESYHSAAQWLVLPRHKLGHNEYLPCPGQQRTHWVFSSAAASWDSCWVPAQIVFQMPRERSENKKGYEEAIRANFYAIRSRTQSELFITILWSRSRNENIHHVDSHDIFASSQVIFESRLPGGRPDCQHSSCVSCGGCWPLRTPGPPRRHQPGISASAQTQSAPREPEIFSII